MRRSPDAKDVETLAAPTSGSGGSDRHRVPAFSNGAVIAGKYLVEETIAQGGIGVVVVAKHLALQQRVAIKYLKPKALSNPVIVERFVREARLAAQITSEHVVRVHDVGTLPEAGPFMVMEYLIGEDLGRTIQNGPLPIARAVDYVLQACDALAEAHALRIVHRDIKPENMFLAQRASNNPVLKIIDFGISKVSPRRGEGGGWGTETAGGERFGTPLYMSPEQLRSTSNVDVRTDIWSLGVVLHELLTAALPFSGDDLPQICTSVLTAPPIRLRRCLPEAPPELEASILKCLEKEPGRRYRNVAELAQEIAPFGPPSAPARVERIAEVVRRGGDSIRPPTPPPGTVKIPPSGPSLGRMSLSTTDERAVTTMNVRAPGGTGRRTAIAAVSGLACAGVLVGVALHSLSRTEMPAAANPAPVVTLEPAPAPAPVVVPIAAVEALPAASAPSAKVRSAPKSHPSAAGASAIATPKPAASTPSSRRAQFGERE